MTDNPFKVSRFLCAKFKKGKHSPHSKYNCNIYNGLESKPIHQIPGTKRY